jgi:HTH-type transcriptional regulator/antitoxin HigA
LEEAMNAAIDIDRLIPAWQSLLAEAPICHIESEEDYEQVTVVLNRLLDVVRDDITHPLYSLVTVMGDIVEAYETDLEPFDP